MLRFVRPKYPVGEVLPPLTRSAGLFVDVDSNQTAYDTQLTAIEDALKTYGADHVLGVTVGNEYILSE